MGDWYFARESRQHGPVTLDQLKLMLGSGELTADTSVFGPTLKGWTPARQVPELGGTPSGLPVAEAVGVGTLSYSMPSTGGLAFTAQAMEMLRRTRPWVKFIGIMLFILAGFCAVAGVAMLFTGVSSRRGDAIIGLVYLPFAILYIAPGIYLMRYAKHIGNLQRFGREDMLEQALEAQKSFWKFCGITLIAIIAFYFIAIVVLLLIAVA